jgi:hypothetical protein
MEKGHSELTQIQPQTGRLFPSLSDRDVQRRIPLKPVAQVDVARVVA